MKHSPPIVTLAVSLALGAAPNATAAATGFHPSRPAFVDSTRDRFAPNAVRRARLAYLLPRHRPVSALGFRGPIIVTKPYTVLDLDAIIQSNAPGYTLQPLALNDDGRIVGTAVPPLEDANSLGYIVNDHGSNGFLADSFDYSSFGFVFPTAISNKGGTVAGFTDEYLTFPDHTDEFTLSDLWTLSGATSSTLQIQRRTNPSNIHTFDVANQNITVGGPYYNGATPFPIAKCAISTFFANAITDSGLIVGYSGTRAAVLMLGGCPAYVPNAPAASIADAVAQNGDMILQNFTSNFTPYVLWQKGIVHAQQGIVHDIPVPDGFDASAYFADAIAVNTSDVVVGNVVSVTTGQPVAAFEYANGTSVNLQSLFPPNSGWVASAVTGINDHGEIIGEGYFQSVLTSFALRH